MRTRSLVGFGLILGWYGTFTGVQVEAQPCYRFECDQTQRCEAVQAGADGGRCCCKVECVGGMGGPDCSCISWCIQPCYAPCPTCEFCSDPQLAAGDQAFELTPAVYDRVRQQSLLAGQVLSALTDRLSHPVYSVVAEGVSNADSWYEYAYRVRVTATSARLILDFVFDLPQGAPGPQPVRITADASGNVSLTPLSEQEVGGVRSSAGSVR